MTHTALRILRGVALLMCAASAAPASPPSPAQQAQAFATCAGRLAALAAERRAARAPEVEVLDRNARLFEALVEAALPVDADPSDAVRWRASGWSEMAGLLADRRYRAMTRRGERAQAWIDARARACEQMLLS